MQVVLGSQIKPLAEEQILLLKIKKYGKHREPFINISESTANFI